MSGTVAADSRGTRVLRSACMLPFGGRRISRVPNPIPSSPRDDTKSRAFVRPGLNKSSSVEPPVPCANGTMMSVPASAGETICRGSVAPASVAVTWTCMELLTMMDPVALAPMSMGAKRRWVAGRSVINLRVTPPLSVKNSTSTSTMTLLRFAMVSSEPAALVNLGKK